MYTFKKDPFSSHSKIVKLIQSELKSGSILDIGCASGFIGQQLPSNVYELYGVDLDEKLLIKANKNYKQTWCLDIERDTPSFERRFDILVFADILEHLKNPSSVLEKFLVFGKSKALVIISVPNIANFIIRLFLLFGHFDYIELGILDKSHLRFFTLQTVKRMIEDADLKILKIQTTPLPFPQVLAWSEQGKPFFFLSFLANILASLWRGMFAYQFIILARKKNV